MSLNISKEQVATELAKQPYRIKCSVSEDTWQLEDISDVQRGIHLSFISGVSLGKNGFIELQFDEAGQLGRILVEAHQ